MVAVFFCVDSLAQSPMFKLIAKRSNGCSYLLDQLSSASTQTAYSFRMLDCDYAGDCIRVRRSSDNTESNIGFSGGFLDTSALKTFVGTGGTDDGFIVSIYDQSGNARTATMATSANQPRIMNDGVIDRYDTYVVSYHVDNSDYLGTSAFSAYADSATTNFVMKVATDQSYNAGVTRTNGAYPNPFDIYNNQLFSGDGTATAFYGVTMSETFNAASDLAAWTIKYKQNATKAWKNNSSVADATSTGKAYSGGNIAVLIGRRGDGVTNFVGYFLESITFNAVSEADLSTLRTNQISYYGL